MKGRVGVPVTYADVWEFWLRNRDLASAVDFVTIHILPYWEDFPIPARAAAAHVESIRERMAAAFPGKEILIGETGWPSAGRMREGALPSLVNQALVLQEVLAVASRKGYRVNVIEAFDQPWKRRLEGTVGGYWGLFDDATRQAKFEWGRPVSNHPLWRLAGGGRRRVRGADLRDGIVGRAAGCGSLRAGSPVAVDRAGRRHHDRLGGRTDDLREPRDRRLAPVGGLGRSGRADAAGSGGVRRWCAVAGCQSFADVLARRDGDRPCPAPNGSPGLLIVATTVMAIQVALGLVFDPRYKDFPFAAADRVDRPDRGGGAAGRAAAISGRGSPSGSPPATLALAAVYILFNESVANWQSVWLCVLLLLLCAQSCSLSMATGRAKLRMSRAAASAASATL